MKIRGRRSRHVLLEGFKKGRGFLATPLWKKVRKYLLIGVGAIAVIFIASRLRPEPIAMNSAEVATVWDRGVLRVGVRTDVPGMSSYDENGILVGLEVDLARELAQKIMENDPHYSGGDPLELVEVTSMSVATMLQDGRIDCAIAMMPRHGTSSFVYSMPYYEDPLLFLARPGEEGREITPSTTVGYIQSASSGSLYIPTGDMYTALVAYFDENEKYGLYKDESYSDNFIRFASYTELADGLEEGKVDMIFINEIMAKKYGMKDSFALRAEDPGTLPYAVAVYSDKPALATVADTVIVPPSGEFRANQDLREDSRSHLR